DLLVVPARHMHDEALLHELGRLDRPVLLERSSMASLDEWLLAADQILQRGNHRVALCEAGVRSFDPGSPTLLDLGSLPLLAARSHLPLVVDPSRGPFAARLAEGALALGAGGLSLSVALGLEPPADRKSVV